MQPNSRVAATNAVSTKHLADLTLEEVVSVHLSHIDPHSTKDHFVTSSLRQIEESMTSAIAYPRMRFYGPAMCAFAVFDQLGTCYRNLTKTQPVHQWNRNGFKLGLHNFTDIDGDSPEAQHLYAFRNAQVHDAAYAGQDRSGQWYMFRINESAPTAVCVPTVAWDGTPGALGPDTVTDINDRALIDMARNAIDRAAHLFFDSRQDLDIMMSREQILHQYILWSRKPPSMPNGTPATRPT